MKIKLPKLGMSFTLPRLRNDIFTISKMFNNFFETKCSCKFEDNFFCNQYFSELLKGLIIK